MDMSGFATEFAPGEYRIVNRKIMVPLRSAVERLGGEVSWNVNNKKVKVSLTNTKWEADPETNTMEVSDGSGKTIISEVTYVGHTIWVPIRDALEISGHPVKDVLSDSDKYRIVTL